MEAEPIATTTHTICGYAWGDVTKALIYAIGASDIIRALRWSAELVCSEQGLGKLESTLLNAWAIHVNYIMPLWPKLWLNVISQIRTLWTRANGDIKAIRNTPLVRQLVAEAVITLALSAKKPLPKLPIAADCFKEAETVKKHIRTTGGVGDQYITRKIWDPIHDGEDIKTISNELEAAMKKDNIQLVLFWIIWFMTLDKQKDAPQIKERGPAYLPTKQRKSLVWFMMSLIKEMMNESAYLSVDDRNKLFDCIDLCWGKLGDKGRSNIVAALALSVMNYIHNKDALSITGKIPPPSLKDIRHAAQGIDEIYKSIAEESRKYLLEVPKIVGLTPSAEKEIKTKSIPKITADHKLALSYALI